MAARIKTEIKYHEINLNVIRYPDHDRRISGNIPLNSVAMENFTDYIIKKTDCNDLEMCVDLIKCLIFHPKKDVVAYSIGKLYNIFDDKAIRKFMVEELRNLHYNEEAVVQRYVNESLELIAGEVNSTEIFKMECNLFDNLVHKFGIYITLALNILPHLLNERLVSRVQKSNMTLYLYEMIFLIEVMMKLLESKWEEKYDSLRDQHLDVFIEIEGVETEENEFHKLIDVYALTFRENGHINHLISILNDEDPVVRVMGVDGLIYVLKVLTHFQEHVPFEGTIAMILNSFKISPNLPESFRSRISLKKNSK